MGIRKIFTTPSNTFWGLELTLANWNCKGKIFTNPANTFWGLELKLANMHGKPK